ncbi:dihydrodipicolinate synthase family protein [Jiangella ureilytica]|uniref:Dihydrodipicolinate synthase family protein n=1 Tax=Jiangella ureilytica TaxID=2530374 RepID=A0A4R4RS20_9ACTN|nr:dihydrodipicolinate synthase family protein [Jiangella ureilytica]TDC52767.1 dihydrodipicolinate synthase family protein [Jiangella ureilytica]
MYERCSSSRLRGRFGSITCEKGGGVAIRAYSKEEAKSVARDMLQGIIPGPTVPLNGDGSIDELGWRHNLRYAVDVIKSPGLYINSYYGTFWVFTGAERRRLLEIAVDEVGDRAFLINRCAHASPREAVDLAKHAQSAGADIVSLVLPQFGYVSEDMLVGYFAMVAREIDLGITIMNTNQSGYSISPELMARIGSEIPNVCALKNHMPMESTIRIRELVGDSIVVIDPNEENFLVNMTKYGQRAVFTGTNMMFDREGATPFKDYVDAGLAGRVDEAEKLHDEMAPLRELHHKWILEPWDALSFCPVARVKFWTEQLGMVGGPAPEPLPQMTEAEKRQLRAEMAEAGLID